MLASLREVAIGDEQVEGARTTVLPFAPQMPRIEEEGRFFAWISHLRPNVSIPPHSHELERLADFKMVIDGSIICKGHELTEGDWLWVPSGRSYTFEAGDKGAVLISGWPWN
jgi:hypothetical protein